MRICKFCGTSIEHMRPQAKKCKSPACIAAYDQQKALARYHAKKHDPDFRAARNEARKTPKSKYNLHRNTAKERGIAFNLTFAEWWNLWKDHWNERGKSMCMCRTGDTGAYEIGNVRIDTYSNNKLESINLTKSEKIL